MRPGRLGRPGSQPSAWGLRQETQALRVLQSVFDGASRAARTSPKDATRRQSMRGGGTLSASQRGATTASAAGMHCAASPAAHSTTTRRASETIL